MNKNLRYRAEKAGIKISNKILLYTSSNVEIEAPQGRVARDSLSSRLECLGEEGEFPSGAKQSSKFKPRKSRLRWHNFSL